MRSLQDYINDGGGVGWHCLHMASILMSTVRESEHSLNMSWHNVPDRKATCAHAFVTRCFYLYTQYIQDEYGVCILYTFSDKSVETFNMRFV